MRRKGLIKYGMRKRKLGVWMRVWKGNGFVWVIRFWYGNFFWWYDGFLRNDGLGF